MRAKSQYQMKMEDIVNYDLRNSITPAIQSHIMMNLNIAYEQREMLYKTVLCPQTVTMVFFESCSTIQDWTQAVDFGPYI